MDNSLSATKGEATSYAVAHDRGIETIEAMLTALRSGDVARICMLVDQSATAETSHYGSLSGSAAIAGMFGPFTGTQNVELLFSNVYLAGDLTAARASGYLAGEIAGETQLAFGAVFIADLNRDRHDTAWRVTGIKLQLTWIEGERTLRPQWTFPKFERVWTVGDPLPIIVSEVDAPWHVYPSNLLRAGDTRDVADTYARYSWGIDQADFGLLTGCYTEDASGTFRPMGALSGRHTIIGVLKDFRRAWPMMQHHGEVLGSMIDGDQAAIIVGRLIPQAGQRSGFYGAYYPMRLRRHGSLWRISWSEYRPGWFSRDDMRLDELLEATISGRGDWQE